MNPGGGEGDEDIGASGANDDDQESPMGFFRIVIQQDPVNVVGVIGGNAVFTAAILTGHPALLTYQWQIRFSTSGDWGNLIETPGFYTGVTTTTLTVRSLDTFLASRPTVQVRCHAVFAQSFGAFTAAATLTIPKYVRTVIAPGEVWAPIPGGVGNTGNSGCVIQAIPIEPVGFSGPYTYAWTQISGTVPDTVNNPTSGAPQFIFLASQGTTIISVWKCTVGNGSDSIDSPPLTMFARPTNTPLTFPLNSAAFYSQNGAAVTPVVIGTFNGPWEQSYVAAVRQLSTPTATITDPLDFHTTLSISAPPLPGGGVMVVMTAEYQNPSPAYGIVASGSFFTP